MTFPAVSFVALVLVVVAFAVVAPGGAASPSPPPALSLDVHIVPDSTTLAAAEAADAALHAALPAASSPPAAAASPPATTALEPAKKEPVSAETNPSRMSLAQRRALIQKGGAGELAMAMQRQQKALQPGDEDKENQVDVSA